MKHIISKAALLITAVAGFSSCFFYDIAGAIITTNTIGAFKNKDGTPSGGQVQIFAKANPSTALRTLTVDANGKFTIDSLPAGDYIFQADSAGVKGALSGTIQILDKQQTQYVTLEANTYLGLPIRVQSGVEALYTYGRTLAVDSGVALLPYLPTVDSFPLFVKMQGQAKPISAILRLVNGQFELNVPQIAKVDPEASFRVQDEFVPSISYPTLRVGATEWLAEPLRSSAANLMPDCYANNSKNCETYGNLYDLSDFTALDGHASVCPWGWTIPTVADFQKLIQALSSPQHKLLLGDSVSWLGTAKDAYGFSWKAGGYKNDKNEFVGLGEEGLYWTTTLDSNDNLLFAKISKNADSMSIVALPMSANITAPVRCVKRGGSF